MMGRSFLTLTLLATSPLLAEERAPKPMRPDLALETVVVTADAVKVTVVNRGGDSSGCYLELALYDKRTGNQVEKRQQVVKPLSAGRWQEIVFPAEAAFAGKRFQLEVDSSHRIPERDETNNVSEMLDAPVPKAAPIRIPGKEVRSGDRPPPIRVPGKVATPASTPEPKDPSQPEVDLAAVEVSDNGVVAKGTVRNQSGLPFTGHRTAALVREVRGNFHVLERKTFATESIPALAPGESWEIQADSLHKLKEAKTYVYTLVLDPSDENSDNDSVQKTSTVVRLD